LRFLGGVRRDRLMTAPHTTPRRSYCFHLGCSMLGVLL
jgi:hypothetical protein